MQIATNFSSSLATGEQEDSPRRRASPCPPRGRRNLDPEVTLVLADGAPAYVVSLSGGRGRREAVLIDRDDWDWVSEQVTPVWVVNWGGAKSGRTYVCSGSRAAATAAGALGAKPRVNLHALLYARHNAVDPGQAVVFVNGDRRDLRQCNLEAIQRAELSAYTATGFRADVSYLENTEDEEDPGSGLL